MTQDFLCQAKSIFRRNTVCISREIDKAWHKKDKSGGASEVLEQVYYSIDCNGCMTKETFEQAIGIRLDIPKKKSQRAANTTGQPVKLVVKNENSEEWECPQIFTSQNDEE